MVLHHVALDIFNDHDGVINDHADGEHDAEQGEQVYGKPQGQHAGKRADEGHENRDRADDGGAEALQKQKHHEHHQDDRLEERIDDLLDGDPHEIIGVKGDEILDAVGHGALHVLECFHDAL